MKNDDPLVKGDYTRSAEELIASSNIVAVSVLTGLVMIVLGLIFG